MNFPAYDEAIRARLSVKIGNNRQNKDVWLDRNNTSSQWFDVQFSSSDANESSIKVMGGVEYYIVSAGVDWIDENGNYLKYGAWHDFYIPIKPKIDRYQVTMYDITNKIAAQNGTEGQIGKVYVGQKVYPQYKFTSENSWTSSNNFNGYLYKIVNGEWKYAYGAADMKAH